MTNYIIKNLILITLFNYNFKRIQLIFKIKYKNIITINIKISSILMNFKYNLN